MTNRFVGWNVFAPRAIVDGFDVPNLEPRGNANLQKKNFGTEFIEEISLAGRVESMRRNWSANAPEWLIPTLQVLFPHSGNNLIIQEE